MAGGLNDLSLRKPPFFGVGVAIIQLLVTVWPEPLLHEFPRLLFVLDTARVDLDHPVAVPPRDVPDVRRGSFRGTASFSL